MKTTAIASAIVATLFTLTEARMGVLVPNVMPLFNEIPMPEGQLSYAVTAGIALTAAADPCDQIKVADEMVDYAKTGLQADPDNQNKLVFYAKTFAHAEKEVEVGALPRFCADPALPRNPELKGVLPLVDPASGGQKGMTGEQANAKTEQIYAVLVENPNAAAGVPLPSIAQQMANMGYLDFQDAPAPQVATTSSSASSTISSNAFVTPTSASMNYGSGTSVASSTTLISVESSVPSTTTESPLVATEAVSTITISSEFLPVATPPAVMIPSYGSEQASFTTSLPAAVVSPSPIVIWKCVS